MVQPQEDGPWWQDRAVDAARQLRLDEDQTVAELVPAEWSGIQLLDRVRATIGRRVDVRLAGSVTVSALVVEVGTNWFTVQEQGMTTLVCSKAVRSIAGLSDKAPGDAPPSRIPQTVVWRQWERHRAHVQVQLDHDVSVAGRVLRVGRDFVDLVEHQRDRAPSVYDRTLTVPCDAVAWAMTST